MLLPVSLISQAAGELQKHPELDSGVIQEGQRRSDDAARPRAKPAGKAEIRNSMPRVKTSLAGLKLSMSGFRIEGNVLVSEEGLKTAMEPWVNRELSFPEFEQAVHAVAGYLRENGHPNVQVKISRGAMKDGQVAIALDGLTPRAVDYAQVPVVEARVHVASFRFSGVSVLTPEELQAAVAPWAGKDLTAKEMQAPAEAIANLVRSKGYTLAQAFLPPQKVDGGVLEIRVQEGVVDGSAGKDGISVEGPGKRIKPEVVQKMLAQGVKAGQPLKVENLEKSLLVANELPGVKVRANLVPGNQPGTTQVQAQVEEGKLVNGSVWTDNYGSRYTGENRFNLAVNLNSPTGYGDLLTATGSASSGMKTGKLSWQLPVGAMGGRLGASLSQMTLQLDQQITPVNLDGETNVASLFGSYPLLRSATRNVFVNGSFDSKHLINNLGGVRENDRLVSLATFGLVGDQVDALGGAISWNASLATGRVNLSANAGNQTRDAAGPRTEGGFTKLNWGASRLASLGKDGLWSWYVSLSGQFASKNLDSGEKFQLGGPGGVRAYPVGEAFGDSGYLATLELRRRLGATRLGDVQVFAFADTGSITQYQNTWATWDGGGHPNTYSLSGGGLGASLTQSDKASLKAVVAKKIGSNPNPTSASTDSDGQNKSARIWIIGTVNF